MRKYPISKIASLVDVVPTKCEMAMWVIIKNEKVVSLLMRQLSTTDQMTQKLITIGHHTVFNNEHILAYTDCLFSTYFNGDFFNC